ncbi:GntR family transcriptional regulator [Roseomonas xinghualingensis]|uniref:GntR family transcriptional regulator n=1 Tax=Roseomonas xinghualingensis TaxID=2986475 RepID=UPI0021F22BEC|nr:GntR family transcriptional regulator [Roseomonas sp. SXEYE001]MCV4209918.1 GntR family transcriptional regulator [Roseomonas sp. SXEYE001]
MDLRVAPVTVQAQAVDKLREAILSGHFAPGQRLVEAELCRELGVSRGSVREALRRLEGERLVASVPNKGPSVIALGWEEAAQIYAVRVLLEGEAAALAARAASPAQRAAMAAALDTFDAAVAARDSAGRITTTARFYDILLTACGNGVIEELLRGLHARISLLRSRSMSRKGRAEESAREMRAILNAVVAREPDAARAAAAFHVRAACETARAVMQEHLAA